MAAHEYLLAGDSEYVKRILIEVLDDLDFRVRWSDDWTAVAERGSRLKSVLLGAFAPFVRVGVAIRTLDDDADPATTPDPGAPTAEANVLRLDTRSSGLSGGMMGASKSRSGYAELRRGLVDRFAADHVLLEERDPGPGKLA